MKSFNPPPPFKKVLIIDDNKIDLYLAEMIIKTTCFAKEIVVKSSARSALQYLESLAVNPELLPDLIFLDIRMPEIDGFAFLELYNNLPEVVQKHCIIMMLSSSLDPDDHDRAASNRYVNGFVSKPLSWEKLSVLESKKPDLDLPPVIAAQENLD